MTQTDGLVEQAVADNWTMRQTRVNTCNGNSMCLHEKKKVAGMSVTTLFDLDERSKKVGGWDGD